ncbi:uncharacterized protein LODBEIA_P42610 [Lodderomyces beijingensis]|uniref:Uncharacterized protein n=1 Tax=Lodderomyces beijingensis TaxID=1775926 RepID=A0ABP0ZUR4_9ASCO
MSRRVSSISINSYDENARSRFNFDPPNDPILHPTTPNHGSSTGHNNNIKHNTFSGLANISMPISTSNNENLLLSPPTPPPPLPQPTIASIPSMLTPIHSMFTTKMIYHPPSFTRFSENHNSCEAKLKNMMMSDESYDFVLNPCCDRPSCKFVRNAIIKQSEKMGGSIVSFIGSIDSEENDEKEEKEENKENEGEEEAVEEHDMEMSDVGQDGNESSELALLAKAGSGEAEEDDDVPEVDAIRVARREERECTVAPLRTDSIEKILRFKSVSDANDGEDDEEEEEEEVKDGCSASIDDVDGCIRQMTFQAQVDEKLKKLKSIFRGRGLHRHHRHRANSVSKA